MSEIKAYTSHGHRIIGVPSLGDDRPKSVARCGGARLCKTCSAEAFASLKQFNTLQDKLADQRRVVETREWQFGLD